MSSREGVLPREVIKEMVESGFVSGVHTSTASLDVGFTDEIYRLSHVFLPAVGETVRGVLSQVGHTAQNSTTPLERGVSYLAYLGKWNMPQSVYAYFNPRSFVGRHDVHVRVIADGVSRFDTIPRGWKGELWLLICPKSYPVVVHGVDAMVQARFFSGDTRFTQVEFEIAIHKDKIAWNDEGMEYSVHNISVSDGDGSLILTLGIDSDIVGYRCLRPNTVLDLSKESEYQWEDFFEPMLVTNGFIRLREGEFYILSTKEYVRIPPHLACEMVPMDERSGEFRTHYAGYLDPGWGWGDKGEGKGRPFTLEVRPFEDITLRCGQPIAKIKFERIAGASSVSYDSNAEGTSKFTKQTGPQLPKQFKLNTP